MSIHDSYCDFSSVINGDMKPEKMENERMTPIQEFYRDSTILITGGTGFLGSVIIEKLLRSCSNFKRMYLIMRPKKGKDQKQRLNEMIESSIFASVDRSIFEKVTIINGDISKPMLGLAAEDQKMLIENVSVIIHSAATVKFDEVLAMAVQINIVATRDLIGMAKEMRNLKAFIHISTAYSHCNQKTIDETYYPTNIDSQKLITLTECLDNSQMDLITPLLLKNKPNTYIFTKSVAEELVRKQSKGIPIAIIRPSIIIGAINEPIPGWIESVYGPSGLIIASATGLMRIMQCDSKKKADVIPVDVVSNTVITTAWSLANNRNKDSLEDPPLYNIVSSSRNPITWQEFFKNCHKNWPHTTFAIWYPFLLLKKSGWLVSLLSFFLHFLPALLIDTCAMAIGKNTGLMKISQKIKKLTCLLSFFSTKQWEFTDNNVVQLWNTLDKEDKELFPFDAADIKWNEYFLPYMLVLRTHLLKDDISTIEAGKIKVQRLYWLHCLTSTLIAVLLLYFIYNVFGCWILATFQFIITSLLKSVNGVHIENIS